MRQLVVTTNITLDGVADRMEEWFSPTDVDDDLIAANREHMATTGAVVMGRKTFEEFRGYWPKQTDDATGVSEYLNRTRKYVFSSTLEEPGWENTTTLRGSPADEISELKRQESDGSDLVVSGSISIAQALGEAKVVDEYRLFVYPVVLGQGRRLFTDGMETKLELRGTRAFRSGVVLLTYRTR